MADPANFESVRALLDQHRQELMERYGAVGTGIGAREPGAGEYAIVVYLKSRNDIPREPVALEGVPLRFIVTGEFKSQP